MTIWGIDVRKIKAIHIRKPERGELSTSYYPPDYISPEQGYWKKTVIRNYDGEIQEEDYYTPEEVRNIIESLIFDLQRKPLSLPPLRIEIIHEDIDIISNL